MIASGNSIFQNSENTKDHKLHKDLLEWFPTHERKKVTFLLGFTRFYLKPEILVIQGHPTDRFGGISVRNNNNAFI